MSLCETEVCDGNIVLGTELWKNEASGLTGWAAMPLKVIPLGP